MKQETRGNERKGKTEGIERELEEKGSRMGNAGERNIGDSVSTIGKVKERKGRQGEGDWKIKKKERKERREKKQKEKAGRSRKAEARNRKGENRQEKES